jgi:hypothetical protein
MHPTPNQQACYHSGQQGGVMPGISGMQERSRAHIIGTQSCGCVLGVLDHRKLKGAANLLLATLDLPNRFLPLAD